MENQGCLITKEKMKASKIMAILVVTIVMMNVASAGFASTYLPKEDGKLIFEVEPGIVSDYFIYPQNLGEETQFIKIVLTDPNSTVQNTLEESYEILPNTQSDEFPIKIEIKVPSNTPIGTLFPLGYEILTTDENPNQGIVSFSPVGFSKSFYVRVGQLEEEKKSSIWIWIVGILVVLAIVGFFVIKKARKK